MRAVERVKSIFSLTTFLWCPPILTGLIWATVTYFGGGLLCAYLLGIRPDGIVRWSHNWVLSMDPPAEMPVYVESGAYSGIVPFSRMKNLSSETASDGWYLLDKDRDELMKVWLGENDADLANKEYTGNSTILDLEINDQPLYLISSHQSPGKQGSVRLEMRMMGQSGTEYFVTEEFRDGAVRPIRFFIVPDAMPSLMGAIFLTVLYSCAAIVPVLIAGTIGFWASRAAH